MRHETIGISEFFNKILKGGDNTIETKSRYEVIADLEKQKRTLIVDRDSLDKQLNQKQKELRDLRREVEDAEEDIKNFKDSMASQKETTEALIKSVDDSLNRFAELNKAKA